MREYSIDQKRNIAMAGHHAAGKTSLVEALLFHQGLIDRLGKTEQGNTFCDYTDEEKARHLSIYSTVVRLETKKNRVNLLDQPGVPDFVGEVKSSMRVVDAACFVIDATSGVEVETERSWQYADENNLPRMVVINKLDKERTEFQSTLDKIVDGLSSTCVPFQLPIGAESNFKGVVDLVKMKAIYYDSRGKVEKEDEIPADVLDAAQEWREKLMDFAAETDEEVMAKYLEGEALTEEEIAAGLKRGVLDGTCVPVFCCSATGLIGVPNILDAMIAYMPSPDQRGEIEVKLVGGDEEKIKPTEEGPLVAYIFKTAADPFAGHLAYYRVFSGKLSLERPIYNASTDSSEKPNTLLDLHGKQHNNIPHASAGDIGAIPKLESIKAGHTLCDESHKVLMEPVDFPSPAIQMALFAESKAEEEKLGSGLPRIVEGDPTLHTVRNSDTKELVISGMGELHLNVVKDRMKSQFGIDMKMRTPKVSYKETVTGKSEGKYRHKKQSGGRGQFGEVVIRVEPMPRGEGFEFVDAIVGGAISGKFISSVEKGIQEAMESGVVAGYPVVDVKVTLFDGMMHPVDSSDIAFKIAGSMAFKQVAADCKPILLEPIMSVKVIVPEEYMGDIISDMNTRRGKVMGMTPQDGKSVVKAQVPLAEMFQYCIDLRSLTQARGVFSMEYSHYDPVPQELAEKIIAQAAKEKEEAD